MLGMFRRTRSQTPRSKLASLTVMLGLLACLPATVNGQTEGSLAGRVARLERALDSKGLVDLLSREGFEKLGFKHLLLNVFVFNTPALRCYRSLGFRPLPNRPKPRAYGGELWELVVMKKVASTKAA